MMDFTILSEIIEAVVDEENAVIKNVAVLGEKSKNGWDYTSEAMTDAVRLIEGVPAYENHVENGKREVKTLIGNFQNARIENRKVKADLHLLERYRWLLEVAKKMPKTIGFSISAMGKKVQKATGLVVEALSKVSSVDLVDRPATVDGIFESERQNKMTEQEIIEEKLRLENERKQLIEEQAKLAAEQAKVQAAQRKIAVKEKVEKELSADVITEAFVATLEALNDAQINEAIKDRKAIAEKLRMTPAPRKDNTLPGKKIQEGQAPKMGMKEVKEQLGV